MMSGQTSSSEARNAAMARRRAISKGGAGTLSKPDAALAGLSGNELARARRAMLAKGGKNLSSPPAPSVTAQVEYAKPEPQPEEGAPRVELQNGRAAARLHRARQCMGRGDAPGCRPSGRIRPGPKKVEFGTTLSGSFVTGSQVERTLHVTGNEAGTCRTVTGTEYVGSEQFDQFCSTRPEAAQPKSGVSETSRGSFVTGSQIGRSVRVTGDESGSCKTVTGTEYLGSERFDEFCQRRGFAERPEKAVVGSTQGKGMTVTGSDEARASRVTGTEPGSARVITGAQYSDAGAARLTINGPAKVALTHTVAGRPVTGTEVGRSVKVTGDEAGECIQVSGSEYLSNEQFVSLCNSRPQAAPSKVSESRSRSGQRITGVMATPGPKPTGDEGVGCLLVTGNDNYSGQESPASAEVGQGKAYAVSGTALEGTGRVTGSEIGRLPISGTPYANRSQADCGCRHAAQSERVAMQSSRFVPREYAAKQPEFEAASAEFSIVSPARQAQGRVTGTRYGSAERITGPGDRASGLVSGTPEFRYRDEASPEPVQTPKGVTGEGREQGTRITGDDWARGGRVTGTEGMWSKGRNPTLRGESRRMASGARANKEIERPEIESAKVTGSSGNTGKGALITVSGGARG
ncbi:MAG TPA: CsoS2 family carboxysome shell protein [Burkholderiales bacterium]|nr:CsoS2 family carboxysome shell protein [Burkholderiales bacterium]